MTREEEKKTLDEVLQYTHVPELPEPIKEEDDRVWIYAIAKVLKLNGRKNYALAKVDENGKPKIVKDFGSVACIVKIEELYPYYFLKPQYCKEFKTKKDIISYICDMNNYKEDDVAKLKNSEIKQILNNIFIKNQLFAEKQ